MSIPLWRRSREKFTALWQDVTRGFLYIATSDYTNAYLIVPAAVTGSSETTIGLLGSLWNIAMRVAYSAYAPNVRIRFGVNQTGFVYVKIIPTVTFTSLKKQRQCPLYADQKAETTFSLTATASSSYRQASPEGQLVPDKQKAGQPMTISADIENDLDNTPQQFVFVAQVLNENNVPVHISFAMGSVGAGQTASPSVSWTPKAIGNYTVEVFVWNSLGAPVALVDKQASTFEILA